MRIATWNVNSINARQELVLAWFGEHQPDVACLQELKTVEEKFPRERFEDLGYNCVVLGQKSYNGVALLSKTPVEDVRRGLPGESKITGAMASASNRGTNASTHSRVLAVSASVSFQPRLVGLASST